MHDWLSIEKIIDDTRYTSLRCYSKKMRQTTRQTKNRNLKDEIFRKKNDAKSLFRSLAMPNALSLTSQWISRTQFACRKMLNCVKLN